MYSRYTHTKKSVHKPLWGFNKWFKNEGKKGAICSLYVYVYMHMASPCVGLCLWVFVFAWVYLADLLPVRDASDRAITPSPRPLPAAETVPEGGSRQLEGEDGRYTLQSWSNDTASQHFVFALLIMSQLSAVQMGGYAMSITHSQSKPVWISMPRIRWLISSCSLKVFRNHISLSYGNVALRAVSEKTQCSPPAARLLLSQGSRLCWSMAAGQDGGPPLSGKFCFWGRKLAKKNWCVTASRGYLWIWLEMMVLNEQKPKNKSFADPSSSKHSHILVVLTGGQ